MTVWLGTSGDRDEKPEGFLATPERQRTKTLAPLSYAIYLHKSSGHSFVHCVRRSLLLIFTQTPFHCAKGRAALLAARLWHGGIVGATVAGFLLALAMAASPEFHERFHHGADDKGHHECLATVLHGGGCDDPSTEPIRASFVAPPLEINAVDRSLPAASLFLSFRILEHAPPRPA